MIKIIKDADFTYIDIIDQSSQQVTGGYMIPTEDYDKILKIQKEKAIADD